MCGSLAVLMAQRLHEWGRMKVVAFITEVALMEAMRTSKAALMEAMRTSKAAVMDRIIDHLKLGFVAAKPPPSHVFTEVTLMAAEERGEYF
jgi:hypothetical protein